MPRLCGQSACQRHVARHLAELVFARDRGAMQSHKKKTPPFEMFDPTLNRSIDFERGRSRDVSGEFGSVLAPPGMNGCDL